MLGRPSFLAVLPPRSYYSGWSTHGHAIFDALETLGYSTKRILHDPINPNRLAYSNGADISPLHILVDVILYALIAIRYRPRYILVFLEAHSIALFIVSWILNVRFVHFSAGTHSERILRVPFIGRHVFARAFVHFAVSTYTKERLISSGLASNCHYLPLGYDPTLYFKEKSITRKHGQIVFVGNEKPRKGLSYLIKAISILPETIQHQISLIIIVGNSNEKTQSVILDMLSNHSLHSKYTVLPNVPTELLRRIYNESMVNVLPSQNVRGTFEGFGLTHIEAIASGCLSIGTLDCGNESAIKPGNGYLLDQGSPIGIARALETLLSSPLLAPSGPPPLTWMQVTQQMLKYL